VRKDYWDALGGGGGGVRRESNIKMGPRRREVSVKAAECEFLSD
jgi:hypothetical protein